MSETRFQVLLNPPGPKSSSAHIVVDRKTGRFLGGFGANFYRPWVFPLYTPTGLTVLQEFAYDHPFHNGIFVGQNPVKVNGRIGNFWAMPPRRSKDDAIFNNVGRMESASEVTMESHDCGVRLTRQCVWRDEDEEPILDEIRTADFRCLDDATVCDVTSKKIAAYGDLEFPQTKFGSIGIRVEPRLLPTLDGVIIADNGRRGQPDIVHEGESDFVAYENQMLCGQGFGVMLSILDEDMCGSWFIRDYGMAMYNPTWTQSIHIPKRESWTVSLRVVAYDDALTEKRVAKWLKGTPRVSFFKTPHTSS